MGSPTRILVKISGEALAAERSSGADPGRVEMVARQLVEVAGGGTGLAVVIGGGNFVRGQAAAGQGADRVVADQMGMLGTMINSLSLADMVGRLGGAARVFSAIEMPRVAEIFTARAARAAMEAGEIAVCGGGTGNPFFTTDTAAALRAVELGCDAVLKATKVDGIYDSDPVTNPDAKRFETITHEEAMARDLKVMDMAAFAITRDNRLPIIVFSLDAKGGIAAVLAGSAPSSRVG